MILAEAIRDNLDSIKINGGQMLMEPIHFSIGNRFIISIGAILGSPGQDTHE
mgnify:CR=1 FL=1